MGTTIIPHHHQPAAAASQQPKPFFVMDWLEDLLEQAAKKKKNGTGVVPAVLDATTPSALSLPKTPKSSNRSSIDLNGAQEEEESEAPLSRCLPAEMFLPSLRAEDDDEDKNNNNSRNGDSQKKRDQQQQQPWQKPKSATSAAATRRPALLPPTLPVKKILMMLLMFLKKPGDDEDDDKMKNKNQKGRSSSSLQPPVPTTAFRATPMSSSFRQRSLDIAEAWTVRGKRAACERADWRTAWVCWNNAYEIHMQLGVGCCELERMREVAASALAVPIVTIYHTESSGGGRNFQSVIPVGM